MANSPQSFDHFVGDVCVCLVNLLAPHVPTVVRNPSHVVALDVRLDQDMMVEDVLLAELGDDGLEHNLIDWRDASRVVFCTISTESIP